MAVINNLIVGLTLHLGWANLAATRRYSMPTRTKRNGLCFSAWLTFEKPCCPYVTFCIVA
jgi:hypothetical protein